MVNLSILLNTKKTDKKVFLTDMYDDETQNCLHIEEFTYNSNEKYKKKQVFKSRHGV